MQKRFYFFSVILLLLASAADAQSQSKPSQSNVFSETRLRSQQTAMTVLGVWAGISLASGLALSLQQSNTELQYAGYQNIGWGAVNGAIAVFALVGISRDLALVGAAGGSEQLLLLKEFSEEQTFSKILLINTGLDVAYMTAGGLLMYAARNGLQQGEKLYGTGAGILLQGAFLFVFDLVQVILSGNRIGTVEAYLTPMLGNIPSIPSGSVAATTIGAMLTISF
ncbi:MAG: hypothetical protein IAF08_05430 [Rhizobacter sp.]|nr:hypothetical protein [Chlorobiales bacterium]